MPWLAEAPAVLQVWFPGQEIGDALVISVPAVERHITHIYAKIGARRRADATAFAVANGLV